MGGATMKRSLFVLIFVFSSPLVGEEPPSVVSIDMDRTFARIEREGMDVRSFVALLETPGYSSHPRISSWIDELINRKDPEIDSLVVGLLSKPRWLEHRDNGRLNGWMGTLIRREFSNDADVTTMMRQKPWKQAFLDITSRAYAEMANDATGIRNAVGKALMAAFSNDFYNWSLAKNPRLFTWTMAVLETWENQGFEKDFTDLFGDVDYWSVSRHWVDFKDFDRLSEFLWTKSRLPLALRVDLLRQLPVDNRDRRMLDWILTAIETNGKDYRPDSAEYLTSVLNQVLPDALGRSRDDGIEMTLRMVDILLDQSWQHGQFPDDTQVADALATLARISGSGEPEVEKRMDRILARGNLPFHKVVEILGDPLWRQLPQAPGLVSKLAARPLHRGTEYPFYRQWRRADVDDLLADPYWQKHSALRWTVGRWLGIGLHRRINVKNLTYASCRSLGDMLALKRKLSLY